MSCEARIPRPWDARPRSLTPATRKSELSATSAVLDEGPVAQLVDRLLQLRVGVHDDRAIPGNWLFDRLAGHKQEADALVAGLHCHVIAAAEDNERTVSDLFADQDLAIASVFLGQDTEQLGRVAKRF